MTLRNQLRWGGLFTIIAAGLMNGMNIVVVSGYHNTAIQAVYGVGFTGLVLACTVIHVAQARQAGLFGLLAYLIAVLSLAYANVATFLILAELAGFQSVHAALVAAWEVLPLIRIAVYGVFLGLTLLGLATAWAGVFPRWAGLLVSLGVALQFPAQFAMEMAGPLFFLFTIGGSILLGAGLMWMGWVLWSGKAPVANEALLSPLDQRWGSVLVIFTGFLFSVNAILNNVGELSLPDGVSNLLVYTCLIFAMVILHTAQAHRAGRIGLMGFLFAHLGATLSIIPAFLIMGQLAGAIATNDALSVSWSEIPVGRAGSYLALTGLLLFGVATLRGGVFPRWTGWLIVIGMATILPTEFVTQPYLFLIFWAIGATLVGAGLGWMGWRLWSGLEVGAASPPTTHLP